MSFNFARLNDPAVKAEREQRQKEREMREKQMVEWRKITVGATGHRPDKMGGWADALGGYQKDHPTIVKLREVLLDVLEDLIVNDSRTRFISGGALGFDSLFFWCVHHLKRKYPGIENVLAIPFAKQDIMWKTQQRYWYKRMLEVADQIIDVARQPEYETHQDRGEKAVPLDDFTGEKMKKRNEFMVDQSGVLVAFFDGSSGGTGHCVRYASTNVTYHPRIIRIDPRFDMKPEYF